MKRAVGFFIMMLQAPAFAMTLQEYLRTVSEKHKTIQSLSIAKEAVVERKESADIQFVPVLTAGVGYLSDKNPMGQFAQLRATQTTAKDLKIGIAKKFASGTAISVSAGANEIENEGPILIPNFGKFSTGTLGVAVNQSLWKDFFGQGTRLRWERQEAASAAEVGKYDLQAKALLVEAEVAYWDYLFQSENIKISQATLERAKRIEAWTQRRVNDGISERADLLSAQALVAARRLQLVSAEDNLAAAKRKIRDFLELPDSEALPSLTGNISEVRALNSMIEGKNGKVMALDAYLMSLSSKALSVASQETDDAYKPDLVLGASYNTNNFQPNKGLADAAGQWTDMSLPTLKVGLNFTYMFDTEVKSSAKSAAKKEALAAKLQSERKMLDSDSLWIELNRRYSEMSKRIDAANEISRLQLAAAKAQTDLFNKGRSITANVIKAEEDAAEAELNLTKLKSEQRKMEAQGRLFIVVGEN